MPGDEKEEATWPKILSTLADPDSRLKSVELTSHYQLIDNSGLMQLADAISKNTRLRALNLRNNQFYAQGIEKIGAMLVINKTLISLNLSATRLDKLALLPLAHALASNASLTSLELNSNHLGDEGAEQLAIALQANTGLIRLMVDFCGIGPLGATQLARSLKVNHTLTSLSLSGNKIGSAGAIELAHLLKMKPKLIGLDISYNEIEDRAAEPFVSALETNATLVTLKLQTGNPINFHLAYAIEERVKANRRLVYQVFDAVYANRPDLLTVLIQQGAAVAAQPTALGWDREIGWTPLMLAAYLNHEACASALLNQSVLWARVQGSEEAKKAGGDRFQDAERTALEVAEEHQHFKLAGLIWSHMRKQWPGLRQQTLLIATSADLLHSLLPPPLTALVLDYLSGHSRVERQKRIQWGRIYREYLEPPAECIPLPASALAMHSAHYASAALPLSAHSSSKVPLASPDFFP